MLLFSFGTFHPFDLVSTSFQDFESVNPQIILYSLRSATFEYCSVTRAYISMFLCHTLYELCFYTVLLTVLLEIVSSTGILFFLILLTILLFFYLEWDKRVY